MIISKPVHRRLPMPRTSIVTQVIEYGNKRREQVKTILTQHGIEPPDLQAWAYFAEMDK